MRVLVLVGNDKLGRKLLSKIEDNDSIVTAIDCSSGWVRIWNLLKRGRLKPLLLMKMFLGELRRKDYRVDTANIGSNNDLLRMVLREDVDAIYLYRAGLIVNKKILSVGVRIMNVHCARLPEYAGLGAIDRALKQGDYDQEAVMYKITSVIDKGDALCSEKYLLNPRLPYGDNENIAYEAGIRLMLKELKNIS